LFCRSRKEHGGLQRFYRRASSAALVFLYSGTQGPYPGLDQINVQLPRGVSVLGSIDVAIAIGSEVSNHLNIFVKKDLCAPVAGFVGLLNCQEIMFRTGERFSRFLNLIRNFLDWIHPSAFHPQVR
jgi:hypothetical protein